MTDEVQKQLAFDLRTFQELGVQFVILGVWREKNRLIQYNGDLLDRIIEIPVEPWSEDEFLKVANLGCEELRISIDPKLLKDASDASFSSIGVFQEIMKELCYGSGITDSDSENTKIDKQEALEAAVKTKAEDYSSRHQRALEAIAAGFQNTTLKDGLIPLFLPYYLIKAVLEAGYSGLANGMRRTTLKALIQSKHHRSTDVRDSDMTNLLNGLARLQVSKSISPPIIDYDMNNRMLQIVDSTFYFFLKHANLAEISADIPNPMDAHQGDLGETDRA